jgi:uncharacterized membrane protein YhaH (DUF805 family)
MKNVEHLPPTHWAAWVALGSLLMVSPALFALLKLPHFSTYEGSSGAAWPLRLLLFGPALVGLCMAIVAVMRLRDGVKRNVWTEPELETLRRWTRNPVWIAVSIALFLLGIGIVVTDHGSGHTGLFCFLIAPSQILMNLVNAAKPVANTPEHIDWSGSKTIRSDNWGEPPSGTSN